MTTSPSITLGDGTEIPQIGFGTYQIDPSETRAATGQALSLGYRHVDTAAAYGNEAGVGQAVRESGLRRDEVFVTTKLRNADQGYESALAAFERSRTALGLEVVDLYLIHWPYARHDRFVDSWRALERLRADGVVRSIGVSNFLPEHLERLAAETETVPSIDQIELHPSFQQEPLTRYLGEHRIAAQAYSPLGQGADLEDEAVRSIASAHDVSPAQVVLRWHVQRGTVVIPKTVSPERMRTNLDVVGFELGADEMTAITALEGGRRISGDPATFDFAQV
jgi:2,5-diketo-D-gluconate reductase A